MTRYNDRGANDTPLEFRERFYGDEKQTVNGSYIPKTDEELKGFERESWGEDSARYMFGNYKTTDMMINLLKLIQEKFNYAVDIHPMTTHKDEYMGEHIRKWSIRPRRSNLYTAHVWYNSDECRYEIESLRIKRQRRLSTSCVSTYDQEKTINAINDSKRAASFVAGLRPYGDVEIAEHVADILSPLVWEMVESYGDELKGLFSNFRTDAVSRGCARELLDMLYQMDEGKSPTLSEDGALRETFIKYRDARNDVLAKQEHAGDRSAMCMMRSTITGKIVCIHKALRSPYGEVHIQTFDDFEDLPVEIQGAVMTLETVERDGEGHAKNIGVIKPDYEVFCKEACAFMVPADFVHKFVYGVSQDDN